MKNRLTLSACGCLLFGWLFLGSAPLAAQPPSELRELEEEAVTRAVQAVAPSVVQIQTFGGSENSADNAASNAPATGLIISPDGYVLTSAFSVSHEPSQVLIIQPDGSRHAAAVVAYDLARMLVLLKFEPENPLPVPTSVARADLRVGQTTIAVGRAFAADAPNVSRGILSATNRVWGRAVQTDAKISPLNYGGPLIDLQGRVIGVLAPLSPHASEVTAGAEWYDSGIGFAVPLEDVLRQFERMKQGVNAQPGLLGLSVAGDDLYGERPRVAVILPQSPAGQAGIEVGDLIVEVNGSPVSNQAQLNHALGAHYAGESLSVVIQREGESLSYSVELAAELGEFQPPFLGIRPYPQVANDSENTPTEGVTIRTVYNGSGAAAAGLQMDDRIVALNGEDVRSPAQLRSLIAMHTAGGSIEIRLRRGNDSITSTVVLGTLPTEIPAEVPPLSPPTPLPEQPRAVGVVEITAPEEPQACTAYLPEHYQPIALLVYLAAPGSTESTASLVERFRPWCDQYQVALLLPQPADPTRWQPTETVMIQRMISAMTSRYQIDPSRVAMYGYQAGGTLAWRYAFTHREQISGVVAVAAVPDIHTQIPNYAPLHRLAVLVAAAPDSILWPSLQRKIQQLEENKFPVTLRQLEATNRDLNAEELSEVFRWLDALDRI